MAEGTRDRILDALEKLLLVNGVAQVTLEAVAAQAGVSKGGLLYHFPSKEALLAAMVRRLGERSDQQLADAVAGGTSASEFYLQIPEATEHEELSLFRSIIAALRTVDGQHDEIQKAVTDVMRSWDQGLQAEISDPVQAEIIRLVGDGLYLAAMLGLPQPDPELHRQVVERLLP
ncbi:TetR/AcrR family transcriptional regulator [Rhodococcus sp. ACPA4]|jgi:AcrR family transcriptional regulator|uniref:TetR family transcriptional regulator n=1 Tax=Nocardia globerula TaxID=1818 RepID=A0A652YYK1_NOCGL|nr:MULTISPECIES: TetR/AcrR family transcriptional regulator [Rhodococcus]NMD58867.1 TetR/AcrR family transcriptional regulator [Nocardia globerula]KJF19854.1 Toluene efflux pump ttgABC operon repressor [Rhodococcus sp. AD45]MCE4266720.1 TetR/AcrR family transcriptional regulator [Rhodococcus globerulus]NRI66190.1 TetR/AcrR family transcriptional regulator [Rhodococcus sp. MS16]PBC41526.1 TetR/AcrR family transcriptional regulator [Rhodococcus sp. ACPA4]